MPCCFLSFSKFSWRSARSFAALSILSGWWYNTAAVSECYTGEGLLRTDEIPVLEVEAVQLVASRLCVHHVFIDDEGGALGVVGDTLANLAVLTSVTWSDRVGQDAPAHGRDDVPHWAELAKEVEEFLGGDVEAGGGLAHGG
jgi:hypothetical protein